MKLVIKPHRPLRSFFIVSAAIAAAALAVAIALDYGHWSYLSNSMSTTSKNLGMFERNAELKKQNEQFKRELVRQKRIAQVDDRARAQSQRDIAELQGELAELKQELEFYRDVLASTRTETGARVQGLQIRDGGDGKRYMYRLVLTHVTKDDKVAKGKIEMAIEGRLAGTAHRYGLAEIAESGSQDMSFNFKHFRRFEGTLKMPQDFVPERIRVKVREKNRKQATYDKTYDWSKVLN